MEDIKRQYEYLFTTTDVNSDGLVETNDAVALFKRSGLLPQVLNNVCNNIVLYSSYLTMLLDMEPCWDQWDSGQ